LGPLAQLLLLLLLLLLIFSQYSSVTLLRLSGLRDSSAILATLKIFD